MSVVNRIRIGFAIPLLIAVLIGAISYRTASQIPEASNWVEHTQQSLASVQQLTLDISDLVTLQRASFASGRRADDQWQHLSARIDGQFKVVQHLIADNPNQQKRVAELESKVAQWNSIAQRVMDLERSQGVMGATEVLKGDEVKAIGERVRTLLQEINEEENRLLRERHERAKRSAQIAMQVIGFGTLAAILLGALAVLWISKKITSPIKDLVQAAERIGDGALDCRVSVTTNDELAVLGRAFNAMLSRVQGAHEALQDQTRILESVLNSMADGVAVADQEGHFLLFNPMAKRILKKDATDRGLTDWSAHFGILLPDAATPYPPDQLPLARALRGESVDGAELFLRNDEVPEGAWLRVTARPLIGGNGVLRGGVAVFNDVTERKQTEQRIEKLNQDLLQRATELEIANRELEAFSYSVSHDLRAPLRHIDGYTELLLKSAGPTLGENGMRYAKTIAQSAKNLGMLIDDLLVFSRMGRAEMRATILSLDDLTQDVLREFEPDLKDRAVTWKIGELPTVHGDPQMLRLVLVNLLSNALKYTRTREQAEIEVGSSLNGARQAVLFVKDNGVGFDMQYVDKLFGVFQRLHSSKEFEGTGIGLANVRRIINRHGGKTWAEGAVGQGATFYFSLPEWKEAA